MSIKTLLFVCLLLGRGIAAQTLPSAGSELQRIPLPTPPRLELPAVQLPPSPALAPLADSGRTLHLRQLRIHGAQAYSEAELLATSGFGGAGDFSLTQLRAMAERITQLYQRDGYFGSSAYLPEQDLVDGVLRIEVLEGRYGSIRIDNQSAVHDALPAALLDGIQHGALLAYAPLESRLLLLSDLPAVGVSATLAPASTPGQSDLVVALTAQPALSGSVDADTEGNRYTGLQRIGATLNLLEPAGLGDVATLRLLTSAQGLDYARAAYQRQFGKLRASLATSRLDYRLGQDFDSLHASGSAEVWSAQVSYPLLRARGHNLTLALGFDAKTLVDRVEASATRNDKRSAAWVAQLNGEQFDDLGGAGRSGFSLVWTSGELQLGNAALQVTDASSLQSQGHYDKLGFALQRLQRLSPRLSAALALTGQVASRNLDASEQMDLGGVGGVRAYPQGEAPADQALVLNLELHLDLPCGSDAACGQWQWIGFVDSGIATLNKQPWAQGPNSKSLSGTGLGLQWSGGRGLLLKAYYARQLGSAASSTAPGAPERLGLQLVQAF